MEVDGMARWKTMFLYTQVVPSTSMNAGGVLPGGWGKAQILMVILV